MGWSMIVRQTLAMAILAAGIQGWGCSRSGDRAPAGPTIGFALTTLNNPFFIDVKKGAEEAAARNGAALILQAAERDIDVEKQMQIVENLIERKVNAICITPNGSREIVPAILKANAAGIPVFIVDSRVDEKTLREAGGNIASFAGSDNFEGGRLAGEYVIRRLGGKGRVAILEGATGHETGDSRKAGFLSAIAGAPGIVLAASQPANMDRGLGYATFQNILQANPDLQAVFACNDMMALGAVEAIAASGRTGNVVVVGFDAIEEAREAVVRGQMDATIAQFPREMGIVAVESACRFLKGEKVAAFVPTKIELVTRDSRATAP
jgi:ribose transport system substrate-binding protein